MEPLHSETSSEVEEVREYAADLLNHLRWMVGINSVLLQEAGGLVEIKKEILEGIDLDKARTIITYNDEKEVYTVEGVIDES